MPLIFGPEVVTLEGRLLAAPGPSALLYYQNTEISSFVAINLAIIRLISLCLAQFILGSVK